MKLEFVFDERLYPGARPTEASVPQTDFDDVAGPQVPVDDMDQQRLLERAFAAFDVVTNFELLRRGRRVLRCAARSAIG